MNRQELMHLIRAASDIGDDEEMIVIGSQSILGQFPESGNNPLLSYSNEADMYFKNRIENTIYIEGMLGEGSLFHHTFGYYAQEVGPKTAILPMGWEERLIPVKVKKHGTSTATGYCLDAHDLAIAKYVAGRPKDYDFLAVMINKGMLKKKKLIGLLFKTPGIDHVMVQGKIRRDFKQYGNKPIDYNKKFPYLKEKPHKPCNDPGKEAFIKVVKERLGKK